jgi:hypothetical protein
VAQREALDAAVRFVDEFDEFARFFSAAIAHEFSIGEGTANIGTRDMGLYLSVFMSVLPKENDPGRTRRMGLQRLARNRLCKGKATRFR